MRSCCFVMFATLVLCGCNQGSDPSASGRSEATPTSNSSEATSGEPEAAEPPLPERDGVQFTVANKNEDMSAVIQVGLSSVQEIRVFITDDAGGSLLQNSTGTVTVQSTGETVPLQLSPNQKYLTGTAASTIRVPTTVAVSLSIVDFGNIDREVTIENVTPTAD